LAADGSDREVKEILVIDVATAINASQALSIELDLHALIETLVRMAAERAGVQRALLMLLRGEELRIEAEALCVHDTVEVRRRDAVVTPDDLPQFALQQVRRTRKPVVLDDASANGLYCEDEYVRRRGPLSALYLPIVLGQITLLGVLYLENPPARHAFTPDRIALLELLAAQAAISLENARRYSDLYRENCELKRTEEGLRRSEDAFRRSEEFLKEAQRLSLTGGFAWCISTDEITWSPQLYRIFEFDPAVRVTLELIGSRVYPEDMPLLGDMLERARNEADDFEYEHRLLMPDGSVKYVHLVAHASRDGNGRLEYIGAAQDVTQNRLAQAALTKARSELAHVSRVTSLGALTASIAHEVNQPLSGIVTNANTCLRMLAADPPNIEGARDTARRAIRDGNRASDVIMRLRALFTKKTAASEAVDLNEATREVISLSLSELQRSRVILRTELAEDLPPICGDRVQLQQVIMNLLLNAADAMSGVEDRPRLLLIKTERASDEGDSVCLAVQDSGIGFEPSGVERLFDAFYTTKSGGMGIGLSVSRSIIESHGGRLGAAANEGSPGATFWFSIPHAGAPLVHQHGAEAE
jgi:signal transduction histidine kinase